MFQTADEGFRKTSRSTKENTRDSATIIGDCLYCQDLHKDALIMHRKAYKGYKETLGSTPEGTLHSADKLGDSLFRQVYQTQRACIEKPMKDTEGH
jgi:hypothetical protein